MPWFFILFPFWSFPIAGWIIILLDITSMRDVIFTTGACVMTGAPIISIAVFLSVYSKYREAKIRAKRDVRIARKEEKNEVREPDTVPEV